MRELLALAFGPRARLREAAATDGVGDAYIFGSWAAAWAGEQLSRPIGDIDLLVLGDPGREVLYPAVDRAGQDLNRQVQVQIRPAGWLENGAGSFPETVVGRPMLRIYPDDPATQVEHASTAGRARSSAHRASASVAAIGRLGPCAPGSCVKHG